jgi:mono/diheme cytochrome c family protein
MQIPHRTIRISATLLLCFVLTCAAFKTRGAQSQKTPPSDQQYQQLIHSVAGPDLFRAYCASCHGSDAKGHGPAADALKVKVPDLTALSRNHKGQFPEAFVRKTIMGDAAMPAHGSREMPVWGPIFHQVEEDVDRGNVRLENLVRYLDSIQTTDPSGTLPGAELYKSHCASCHGNDLMGNGPAPPPFRDVPPDLTTLAQRHGGEFPTAYFISVLRDGVVLQAHGPPEMPIWGADFKAGEHLSEAQVKSRITDLADYIKSLQAK